MNKLPIGYVGYTKHQITNKWDGASNHFLSTSLRVYLVSTSVYFSLYINQPAPISTYWLPRWAKLFKRKWQVAALACSVQWNWKPNPRNALCHIRADLLQLCILLFNLSFFLLFSLILFLKNQIHIIIAIWFSCKPMAILLWINPPIFLY